MPESTKAIMESMVHVAVSQNYGQWWYDRMFNHLVSQYGENGGTIFNETVSRKKSEIWQVK